MMKYSEQKQHHTHTQIQNKSQSLYNDDDGVAVKSLELRPMNEGNTRQKIQQQTSIISKKAPN